MGSFEEEGDDDPYPWRLMGIFGLFLFSAFMVPWCWRAAGGRDVSLIGNVRVAARSPGKQGKGGRQATRATGHKATSYPLQAVYTYRRSLALAGWLAAGMEMHLRRPLPLSIIAPSLSYPPPLSLSLSLSGFGCCLLTLSVCLSVSRL